MTYRISVVLKYDLLHEGWGMGIPTIDSLGILHTRGVVVPYTTHAYFIQYHDTISTKNIVVVKII